MRLGSCLVAAAVVSACVSGAAAAPSVSGGSRSATHGAAPLPGYNFKAHVQLKIVVNWSERSGSSSIPCSEWRQSVGMSVVYVKGAAVPGRFQLERNKKGNYVVHFEGQTPDNGKPLMVALLLSTEGDRVLREELTLRRDLPGKKDEGGKKDGEKKDEPKKDDGGGKK